MKEVNLRLPWKAGEVAWAVRRYRHRARVMTAKAVP